MKVRAGVIESSTRLVDSLFETWAPSLFRYALSLTDSRELAEDLVQEAFTSLYRELVLGGGVKNPKGWTLCVVRHLVFKHRRDQQRHGEELQPFDVLDGFPGKALEIGAERHLGDFSQLFPMLTPREEEVIVLRMESLKYREIAAQLGVSEKTVGALLARALEKLNRVVTARARREKRATVDRKAREGVPATLQ